jgi:hypothetical protein
MTAAPKTQAAPPANPAATIVRVILLAVLAYMIVWLAYDYLYVFPTHEKKFVELQELVSKETSRSAVDIKENGPTDPERVAEFIGFAPSTSEDKGHFLEEKFVFHRGFPLLSRNLYVFYKKYQGYDKPGIVQVAKTEKDLEASRPLPPVVPKEDIPEDGDSTEKKPEEKPMTDEKPSAPEKKPETDDKPAEGEKKPD